MITIRAEQMETVSRLLFYERLKGFAHANALRADWKTWMSDSARLHAIWDRIWPQARECNEHDCALCLILAAIRSFEGNGIDDAADLLAQIPTRETALKQYVADRGYLRFSAFDYPDGIPDEDAAHV